MPPPYSAGSVFLQVVPSFAGVQDEIKSHAERYGKLFGDVAGEKMGEGLKDGVAKGVDEAAKKAGEGGAKAGKEYAKEFTREAGKETSKELVRQMDRGAAEAGEKAGRTAAGKFATTLRAQAKAMSKNMDAIKIGVDDEEALRGLDRLQSAVHKLQQGKLGVNFDAEEAAQAMAELEVILNRMSDEAIDIRTKVDLDQAARDAGVMRKMVQSVLEKPVQIPTEIKKPERLIGNFERVFQKSIDGALNNLPPLDLAVDDASVSAEVDRIRRELAQLRDARLGIDLSSEEALTKLRTLLTALAALDGKTADVRVRSDIGSTARELRTVFGLVEAIEKADAKVNVRAEGAPAAANNLRNVNRETRSTSANGMDAANAFRAFNGRIFAFVALAPAAIPLLGALAGGLMGVAGAAGIAGVGMGVAALGLSGIKDAVSEMENVQEQAAGGAASSARQMRGAERAIRDAQRGLDRARADGAQSIEDAERKVADAQRDALEAQKDLIEARREGGRQLEDLALRARGGDIAERQAALDLAKAQADYISTFADGASTNVEREQVAIALEREKLGYEQARLENSRLQDQQAEAARTGVEGTEVYQDALGKVTSANEDVVDAERERQRTQVDVAQSIADATQNLTDAQEDYAEALADTGSGGGAAMRNLKNAMDDLGPAGRDFAKYLYGLKPFIKELRADAQAGLLPGVQSWMDSIFGYNGPQLQSVVRGVSGALGDVFEMWGESLKGEAFGEFFDMIEGEGPRWIREMGEGVTDLGEGLAYLLGAAEPFTDLFLGYFRELSDDFRDWASQVKGSTWLQDFFEYVRRVAPEAGEFVKEFFGAVLNLLISLAPYGEIVMEFLTSFLGWVNDMDPRLLGAIATGIIGITLAMQTIFGLTSLVKSAEAAWHLATGTLGGFAGKIPLLAGGLVGLVAGFAILYMSSEDFRDIVHEVVEGLGDLIGWLDETTGSVGALGTVAAGMIGLKVLPGYIAGMVSPTNQLASATDLLGGKVDRTSRAVSALTRSLGYLAIAYAAYELLTMDRNANTDDWTGMMMEGPQGLDKARQEMQAKRAEIEKDRAETGTVKGFFSLDRNDSLRMPWATTPEEDFAKAQQQYQQQLDAMTPLARAQYDVKLATDELSRAQEKYGTSSYEAAAATSTLKDKAAELERIQGNLDNATRTTTDAIIAQANAQLAAADSSIAFESATLNARKAQERYEQVLADGNATADQRKEAELGLRSAYLQVAGAALRQAEDAAKLRGETLSSTDAANAQLTALKNLRDTMGEDVPDAINTLIADLESTAGMAGKVTEAVDGVTGAINAVPGQKSVTVNALTEEAKAILTDLGIRVETFPDGETTLTANDDPAQIALDAFLDAAAKRDIVIPLKPPTWFGSFLDATITGDYSKVRGVIPTGPPPTGPQPLPGLFPIPRKARGGPIVGPGGPREDRVPILASDGEYMIQASTVDMLGLDFFHLLNAGFLDLGAVLNLPAFAGGGSISDSTSNFYAGSTYLPPGVSAAVAANAGRASALSAEEINLLRDGGGIEGGGDHWDVDINEAGVDGEQIVGTLMHKVRVIKRGGKYARARG